MVLTFEPVFSYSLQNVSENYSTLCTGSTMAKYNGMLQACHTFYMVEVCQYLDPELQQNDSLISLTLFSQPKPNTISMLNAPL